MTMRGHALLHLGLDISQVTADGFINVLLFKLKILTYVAAE